MRLPRFSAFPKILNLITEVLFSSLLWETSVTAKLRAKKGTVSFHISRAQLSIRWSTLCLRSAEAGRTQQLSASVMTVLLQWIRCSSTNVQLSGGAEKATANRTGLSEVKALEVKVEEASSPAYRQKKKNNFLQYPTCVFWGSTI